MNPEESTVQRQLAERARHYAQVRHDPDFRRQLQIENLEIEREPAWWPYRSNTAIEKKGDNGYNADVFTRLDSEIKQLKGLTIYLRNKLNEHIERSKEFRERKRR